MPYSLDGKLVVGITSRALFDLDESNAVYEAQGLKAFRAYQRAHEKEPLKPGTGHALVRGLLKINERVAERLVEVVVISRNDADTGVRVFNSARTHGLDITRGAFTSGRDPWKYLQAFRCSLFLSAHPRDVEEAIRSGFPAACVLRPPERPQDDIHEVRIAFDGDAVLFDAESERVFQEEGLEAFLRREAELADTPMNPGPFEPFLRALHAVQARFPEEEPPIRIALVTARNAPAHQRVVNTLRAWGVRIDESFFLGGIAKKDVLAALGPHIFFDDQRVHLEPAASTTASAHVVAHLEPIANHDGVADIPRRPLAPSPSPREANRRETKRDSSASSGGGGAVAADA